MCSPEVGSWRVPPPGWNRRRLASRPRRPRYLDSVPRSAASSSGKLQFSSVFVSASAPRSVPARRRQTPAPADEAWIKNTSQTLLIHYPGSLPGDQSQEASVDISVKKNLGWFILPAFMGKKKCKNDNNSRDAHFSLDRDDQMTSQHVLKQGVSNPSSIGWCG